MPVGTISVYKHDENDWRVSYAGEESTYRFDDKYQALSFALAAQWGAKKCQELILNTEKIIS